MRSLPSAAATAIHMKACLVSSGSYLALFADFQVHQGPDEEKDVTDMAVILNFEDNPVPTLGKLTQWAGRVADYYLEQRPNTQAYTCELMLSLDAYEEVSEYYIQHAKATDRWVLVEWSFNSFVIIVEEV